MLKIPAIGLLFCLAAIPGLSPTEMWETSPLQVEILASRTDLPPVGEIDPGTTALVTIWHDGIELEMED